LDPIADAEEYNVLLHSEGLVTTFDTSQMLEMLRSSGDPWRLKLANRIENLQVLEWDLWSRGGSSVVDAIDERPAQACSTWEDSRIRQSQRWPHWRCWNTCGPKGKHDDPYCSSLMRLTTY